MTTTTRKTTKSADAQKSKPRLTPFLEQYYAVKKQHPDKIVFFRMGDFYEMFGDDAIKAAPILGIALTRRGQSGSEDLPLAGVPYHAAERYLTKLMSAGLKVVVVEQIEDPKTAKGVVKRDIVEILTPGASALDDDSDSGRPKYLASLAPNNLSNGAGTFGLATLDITTAEFMLFDGTLHEITERIGNLSPREVIYPDSLDSAVLNDALRNHSGSITRSDCDAYHFDVTIASETLKRALHVSSLEGFGIAESSASVGAAGAIFEYLKGNRRDSLDHITTLKRHEQSDCMRLDPASVRNLELIEGLSSSDTPTLFTAVNMTLTQPGARRLRSNLIAPFRKRQNILERQKSVSEALIQRELSESVRKLLKELSDIERLAGRVGLRKISPRQLRELAVALNTGQQIIGLLNNVTSALLKKSTTDYPSLGDTADSILNQMVESPPLVSNQGGIFRDGACEQADELKRSIADAKRYMAGLQEQERKATGISSLKIGFNKVFGYYMEVTHAHRDRVPEHYIRKQTLVNAERYITEEMKKHESVILEAEEKINKLEEALFAKLVDKIAEKITSMQSAARILAEIDVVFALSELAHDRGYVKPSLTDDKSLNITGGRHPVIETLLQRGSFVPNDLVLDDKSNSVMILTGPNMAGKSTYLRQIGLIVILAQIGSYVPAESAEIGLVDRIFTRVGAVDKLAQGQSTFMVEMLETANILNNATEESLILLDEVGRGTSTFDGLSIAWAVVEELHERVRARTVFATHYHELTTLADDFERVVNFQVAVKRWQDRIVFLHKIVPGGCDDSYGIEVAKLAGLPPHVLKRAREILRGLEQGDFARPQVSQSADTNRQISLFDLPVRTRPSIIEEALRELKVDSLTPLDALNTLSDLKKKLPNE